MKQLEKERIFYLDFIRALSVLSIVIFHFNASLTTRSIGTIKIFVDTYRNGDLGKIGVSLFFIISGAALMYTYKNEFVLKKYIQKRFLSIYPIFWTAYISVLLYYLYKYYALNPFSPQVPKWTFILSVLGIDGYLVALIPNYYLIGEWFLGCILILYLCFPYLRRLLIIRPKTLIFFSLIIYLFTVQYYSFNFQIDHHILTRLPEFIFGMFFVTYFKRVSLYQFLVALLIGVFLLIRHVDIPDMYLISIIGISLFFVLAYVGQSIKKEKIQKIFFIISKYSFSIFLVHHVIIEQVLERFTNRVVTPVETYCLFAINCIILAFISFYLYKISVTINKYVKNLIS